MKKYKTNDLTENEQSTFPTFRLDEKGTLISNAEFSDNLKENKSMLQRVFAQDNTFICRDFSVARDEKSPCFAVYFDGMVNNTVVYDSVIRPILEAEAPIRSIQMLASKVINNFDTKIIRTAKDCFDAMMMGDCVIFLDRCKEALVASTKGFPVRTPQEPSAEKSLWGPKDGFTESVMMNVALTHRRLKTIDFRAESLSFGTRTNTRAFLCYLGSIVKPELLAEVKLRLSKINMDGILDANYIAEQIADHKGSLFRTVGLTERPDVVAAGLLEGRIALILDGTPVVLQVPYLFAESFQAPEDYYQSFWFASVGRLLRYFCYLLTIFVPGLFVSLVSFHSELLPTDLALSIAQARAGVPFPVAVECFLMIIVFEILREASRRLPDSVAQTLGIVGAIVIGDAAVSARFIGSTTLIVVAFAGITGLMIPRLENSVIILRILFLFAGAFLGLYGILFAFLSIFFYLMTLKSFGVPYLSYCFLPEMQGQKDIYIRAPWGRMRTRPGVFSEDKVRKEP